LPASRFIVLRLARFYPLYAIGLLLAAGWVALELVLSPPARLSWESLFIATSLGLLFLPAPANGEVYPLNPPSWSLLYELAVNLAYAALFPFLNFRVLCGIAFAALVGLIVFLPDGSLSVGVRFDQSPLAILRTVFSFSIGAIIYRARLPKIKIHPAVLIAASTLPMIMPAGKFDLLIVALYFPVFVAAISTTSAPAWNGTFAWLGGMSFALYTVQLPIFEIGVATKGTLPGNIAGTLWLGIAICVAHLLHKYMDSPAQDRIKQMLAVRMKPATGSLSG
jgi:peptidoglycan/LPS O-acetylase OafA/YrhL